MSESMQKEAITFQQMGLLMFISERQPVMGKDIARHLGQSASSITQIVEGLVKDGYVMREQDTKDRRIVYLRLTKAGSGKVERLAALRRAIFIASAKALTDTELRSERDNNRKVLAEVQKLAQKTHK